MLEGLAARACCETCSVADIRELTAIAERVYAFAMAGRDQERADLVVISTIAFLKSPATWCSSASPARITSSGWLC